MVQQSVLCPHLLPLESVRLGRFVINVDDPVQDFFDPPGLVPETGTIIQNSQEQYSATQDAEAKRSLTVILTNLFSASSSKDTNSASKISADLFKSYKLSNQRDWYEKAIAITATQKWIEKTSRAGDDSFLIVGFHTMLGAKVAEGDGAAADMALKAKIPAGEALAAAGIPPLLGQNADLGVEAHNQHSRKALQAYVAPGEQVCAVQYRKVRLRWFFGHDIEGSSLEKGSTWMKHGKLRSSAAGAENMIEAVLDDDLGLDASYDQAEVGEDVERFFWKET